jgi:sortase (surface protein transpeptidase)
MAAVHTVAPATGAQYKKKNNNYKNKKNKNKKKNKKKKKKKKKKEEEKEVHPNIILSIPVANLVTFPLLNPNSFLSTS